MRESDYQRNLVKKIKQMFPGCVVTRNDPKENQGFPDITIFYEDRWAMLEVKISAKAHEQPNQRYHIETMNDMSFAAFIYPENEREVLDELQRSFGSTREARVS